jgi:flagellar biosynthesis chaperone FliJ
LDLTMAKKILYNNNARRRNAGRHAKELNRYASSPPPPNSPNFPDKVDKFLNAETFDEKLQRQRRENLTKTASSKKSLLGKSKKDEEYASEDDEAPNLDNRKEDGYESEEIGANKSFLDDTTPESTKRPKKSDQSKRRKTTPTSTNSVSSTESSTSTRGNLSMRDRNEEHRVQDANDRIHTGSASSKMLMQYKQQVDALTRANRQKDQQLEELESNLDQVSQKLDGVSEEYVKAKGYLSAIVQNPTLLTKKKRTVQAIEDADDEDLEVLQKDKNMVDEGQKAVKIVFRTIKFIMNQKQEDMFCDAVMDNYGKEELLVYPGENDEQARKVKPNPWHSKLILKKKYAKLMFLPGATPAEKREVTRFRKAFKNTYASGWISYLNTHRSYTQVSVQWS